MRVYASKRLTKCQVLWAVLYPSLQSEDPNFSTLGPCLWQISNLTGPHSLILKEDDSIIPTSLPNCCEEQMSLLRKCSVNKQYRSRQIFTIIMLLFYILFYSPKVFEPVHYYYPKQNLESTFRNQEKFAGKKKNRAVKWRGEVITYRVSLKLWKWKVKAGWGDGEREVGIAILRTSSLFSSEVCTPSMDPENGHWI